jgi:branched-chain amino acid transport system substrate-binding protein
MRKRLLFLIPLVVVTSMVAAACGSSSSSPSAGSSGSATGTPIKVGVVCSCTGPFGATGIADAGKVAKAWAESVNAAGGIQGHPVDLVVDDDASNPATSVTAATSLIGAHVAVILDLTTLDATWEKQVDAAKIPSVGGTSALDYTDPNFYPAGQTQDSVPYAAVAMSKAAGGNTVGVLYCAEAPQCQGITTPIKQIASQQGLKYTYSASIAATAPNYTAQCLGAKQNGVNALFVSHASGVFVHVAQDCTTQGYNPAFIENALGFTMQVASAPGVIWGFYPNTPFWASDRPEVKEMDTALDKYSPGLTDDTNGFSQFSASAWVGGKLIEAAVENAGVSAGDTVDAAAVTRGLDSMHNETLGGWVPGVLNFTAGKPHSVPCFYEGRVQGGAPKLLSTTPTCQGSAS